MVTCSKIIQMQTDSGNLQGSFCLPNQSLAAQYLLWLDSCSSDSVDISNVTTIIEEDMADSAFITVIVRTQGTREEKLREVLLCLSAQTDSDFELIIVGHNISDEGMRSVSDLVDSQVEDFRHRIRFVVVQGGKRARPLNVGFELAHGGYVTILDDDDIVFDNWIEAFHETAKEGYGAIIHNGVFTQAWEAGQMHGDEFLRAIGSPEPGYCDAFDPLFQITTNKCPTMSLAFPSFVFKQCGLRFSEDLTTTEDWDFLMRAANVCGVVEGNQPVAIYRLWKDGNDSHTLHSYEEWEKNRLAVLADFAKMPLLMPVGSSDAIAENSEFAYRGVNPLYAKLYYSADTVFDESKTLSASSYLFDSTTKMAVYKFDDLEKLQAISSLRFDPTPSGGITISGVSIAIVYPDGVKKEYPFYGIQGNGIASKTGTLAFLCNDPQMVISLGEPSLIAGLEISFKFSDKVDEALLMGTKILVRAKAKAHRAKYRITGQ